MLIMSSPGVGKTSFLGSGAGIKAGDWDKGRNIPPKTYSLDLRFCPCLHLDFESSNKAIKSKIVRVEEPEGIWKGLEMGDKGIVSYRPKYWQEFETILGFLESSSPKMIFRSVCIDTLTECNQMNLRYTIAESVKRRPRTKGEEEFPQIGDYGDSALSMRKMVRRIRDIKIHAFYTTWAVTEQLELTKEIETTPALVGKLSGELPGLMDIVGYMSAERTQAGTVRRLRFQPDYRVKAKNNTEGGELGEYQDDFTISQLFDIMKIPMPNEQITSVENEE